MPKEIERRFLVRSLAKNIPKPTREIKIEQGYFEMADITQSLRVRISDGEKAVLTMKTGKGFIREEVECPIDLSFAKLLMASCHHKLDKERWLIEGWEIDLYEPPLEGVIIAEKEMATPDEKLFLPSWLKGITEVTETLTNHHLARLASDLRGTNAFPIPYLSSQIFNTIPKIVLTGGPCSGKSTVIEKIKKERPDIHCVPEMATILISQFKNLPGKDKVSGRRFQRAVYRAQRILEATSTQFAISEGKKAIIFDRGSLDGAAYTEGGLDEFEKELKISRQDEYGQYDQVICLAVPIKKVYEENKDNNP